MELGLAQGGEGPFSLEAALRHFDAHPVVEYAASGVHAQRISSSDLAAVEQALPAAQVQQAEAEQPLPSASEQEEVAEEEAEDSMETAQGCVFCGVLGASSSCGPLRPATVNGIPVMVHHLCALWAPQVYQQEGSDHYINLEDEYRRAEGRVCTACGYTGAAISCTDPGCKCTYHLPCAITAPNVFLDVDAFELWCPVHADQDEDESGDYGSVHTSSRGRGRGAVTSRRQRAPFNDTQRSRTDWQKRDEQTWVKIVPPWWAEHKTVHFASKVYKELFRSAATVIVVDAAGAERLCTVQSESRNDARQQYTLRGRFSEVWDASGVQAGDALTFRLDHDTNKVTMLRQPASAVVVAGEQGSILSQPAETTQSQRKASSSVDRQARGVSQQGSHPNRWMELTDGWCIKTVYKSTIAHQQCPVAGWLFKKLYGRLPSESDRAVMTDPDLNTEYRFDVNFIGAANVHYITGRNFGAWIRESGLRAQEQIRVKKEGNRVLIQRVPSDMRVHVDFSRGNSKAANTRAAPANNTPPSSDTVVPSVQVTGTSAGVNPDDPMEALDSLAAAAGFAAVHGTPAIAAALAAPPAAAAAVAASMTLRSSQVQQAAVQQMHAQIAAQAAAAAALQGRQSQQQPQPGAQQGVQQLHAQQPAGSVKDEPSMGVAGVLLGKRRRTSTMNDSALHPPNAGSGTLAGLWPPMSGFPANSSGAAQLVGAGGQQQQQAAGPFSSSEWEPNSSPHWQMYQALLDIVAKHEWGAEEQETVLKFRARYGRLDEVGREITFYNVRQHQADREKLLMVLQAIAD